MEEDFILRQTSEWEERDRQEEEWSILVSVRGRGVDIPGE